MTLEYCVEEDRIHDGGKYLIENSRRMWEFYTPKSLTEDFEEIVYDIAEDYYGAKFGFKSGRPALIFIWTLAHEFLGMYYVQIKHSPQFIIGENLKTRGDWTNFYPQFVSKCKIDVKV